MRIVLYEGALYDGSFLSAPHIDSVEEGNCIAWEYGPTKEAARLKVREKIEEVMEAARKNLELGRQYIELLEDMNYWDEQ